MAKKKSHAIKPKQKPRRKDDSARWLKEQNEAIEYTEQWHRTRDAAARAMESVTGNRAQFPRLPGQQTTIVRSNLIASPTSKRAVRDNGWDAEALADTLSEIDDMPVSGHRRALVRVLAWLVSDEDGDVYDPVWITLVPKVAPDANNLRTAFRNAKDWLDHYLTELQFQVASKLLVFSAIEVAFWTSGPNTAYL